MRRQHMLTKNDMARLVVQAMHEMPELPAADARAVKRVERMRKEVLADQHKLAMRHFAKIIKATA